MLTLKPGKYLMEGYWRRGYDDFKYICFIFRVGNDGQHFDWFHFRGTFRCLSEEERDVPMSRLDEFIDRSKGEIDDEWQPELTFVESEHEWLFQFLPA